MMQFQASEHSSYGSANNAALEAQQVMQSRTDRMWGYGPEGQSVGDIGYLGDYLGKADPGFFDRAADRAAAEGIDTGVNTKKTGNLLDAVLSFGTGAADKLGAYKAGQDGEEPECRRPPTYVLWGKQKKAAFNAQCEAARAEWETAYALTSTPEPKTSAVPYIVGGIVLLGLIGGAVAYSQR